MARAKRGSGKKKQHLTECYKSVYPNDPAAYCTCLEAYPE